MRVRPLVLAVLAVFPLQAVAQAPPWHLDRLNQRSLPMDGNALPFFPGPAEPDGTAYLGQGALLFVMGAPIPASQEFGARLQGGTTGSTYTHESIVASIAAGTNYGIAKMATVQSLQAVDAQGYAYWPDEVKGFNEILAYMKTHKGQPAVLLFSYTPVPAPIRSSPEDPWFKKLNDAGVNVVVAAGNFANADACQSWKTSHAIVVGATKPGDIVGSGSTGKCVEMWAPGQNTVSAFATSSGSSDSAAMAAGVLLSIRSQFPWLSPSSAQNVLFASANQGAVTGNLAGAANRLLYYSGRVTETLSLSAKQSGKTLTVSGRAILPNGLAGSSIAWVYRGRSDANGICQGQGTQVKVSGNGSFSLNKNITASSVCVMTELGTVGSVPVR